MTENEDDVEMMWVLCDSCDMWHYLTCVNLENPPAGDWFRDICV